MRYTAMLLLLAMLISGQMSEAQDMKKALIVYGSFTGSTTEIADHIKDFMSEKGIPVVSVSAKDVKDDISGYNPIIIGSAIRAGSPHETIRKFVEDNGAALRQKDIYVFAVCMSKGSGDKQRETEAWSYPDKIAKDLNVKDKAVFSGKMDYSKLNWVESGLMKLMGAKEEDRRNWKEIDAWAQSIISNQD